MGRFLLLDKSEKLKMTAQIEYMLSLTVVVASYSEDWMLNGNRKA